FFHLWNNLCNAERGLASNKVLKLEFYLRIYFATHTPLPEKKTEAIEGFKHFLETKGAVFSQENEFLPYYALPYVPHPENHPMYKELYSSKWVSSLEERLYTSLKDLITQPQLFNLLDNNPTLVPCSYEPQASIEELKEMEQRLQKTKSRYSKLYSDYQSLISVSTDLVDALEANLRGKKLDEDFLQKICTRLLPNQQHSADTPTQSPRHKEHVNTLRNSISLKDSIADTKLTSSADLTPRHFIKLDFSAVKETLLQDSVINRSLLLQAIRWTLTKSENLLRYKWLEEYISNDLMDLGTINSVDLNTNTNFDGVSWVYKSLSSNEDSLVIEQFSRLLNTLASMSRGRAYLTQSVSILNLMIDRVFAEKEESSVRGNLIGALQKLSLKRSVQGILIERGGISWLVNLLDNSGEDVSDYSLEYAVALMMNLCLRSSGKKSCIPIASRALKVLTDLLGNAESDIIPYINGAIYSILSMEQIRKVALSMDLEGVLRYFIKEGRPEMNRQFEYIIKQLNKEVDGDLAKSQDMTSEDEEDDDDSEDGDSIEMFMDEDDSLEKETGPEFLAGDDLLTAKYMSKDGNRDSLTLTKSIPKASVEMRASKKSFDGTGLMKRPSTPQMSRTKTSSLIKAPTEVQVDKFSMNTESQEITREPLQSHPEYKMAFNSKPRIPRTPDTDGSSPKFGSSSSRMTAHVLLSQDPNQ
ncbi:LisH domain-containing protein armc9, partial [Cichlidogyrus casuarinus]